jgi:hypothetical protein
MSSQKQEHASFIMIVPYFVEIQRLVVKLAMLIVLTPVMYRANATDSDPRSYSNIPVGLNFLITGYARTTGNVTVAPTIPLKNANLTIDSAVLAFSHSLNIFGKSGKFDFILPGSSLSGTADFEGQPHARSVVGFADPMARFYVNFYGAPALSMKDFAAYKQNLIIGASLAVTAPGGQYDQTKLVNLGTNRWSFKPELGISKAWGPLTTELAAGGYFYTDNNEPVTGNSLKQAPLFTAQGHLIYNFRPGIWGAFDANYYAGARTTNDGHVTGESLGNWRVGGTLAVAVHRQHSIKLYGSTGVYSRTGSTFDIIGIAWQYRWGDGL